MLQESHFAPVQIDLVIRMSRAKPDGKFILHAKHYMERSQPKSMLIS